MTERLALDLQGVSRRFGNVDALSDVALAVRPGEVHGLLGQNGSGKSTLVKILAGYHDPDEVAVAEAWGEPLKLSGRDTQARGIAIIHQDLALVPTMTVAENLGISVGYGRSPFARVRWADERRTAAELLDEFGVRVDPSQLVETLTPGERAPVAIARAMRQLRRTSAEQVLVLDEPTAYLSASEAASIVRLVRELADRGSSVLFISHRLAEVMEVCDRATILRDGRNVATVEIADSTPRSLIELMLGRDLGEFYPDPLPLPQGSPVVMAARGLTGDVVDDLDLDLRAGEITGITGLVGMGQQELPGLLAGGAPARAGTLSVADEELEAPTPSALRRRGVVLVPGDRQRDGVWLDATATENVTLPVLDRFFDRGRLQPRNQTAATRDLMERFGVRPVDPARKLSGFSGGNQQKLVLAKWLQTGPRVLVLDEPTQGVDAGAKREILQLVQDMARDGAAVVMCSADHEQVANFCTRAVVLHEGRRVAELTGDALTEPAILEHCHAAFA